jgi:hypothetical protein
VCLTALGLMDSSYTGRKSRPRFIIGGHELSVGEDLGQAKDLQS